MGFQEKSWVSEGGAKFRVGLELWMWSAGFKAHKSLRRRKKAQEISIPWHREFVGV